MFQALTENTGIASFKYHALELPTTIRLVVLENGSHQDIVRCRLVHSDFQSGRPYEALSYEWGMPSDDNPFIFVDDCPVQVRRNLFDALLQIRLENTHRYMWIDALSIEQANVKERNHQVKLTGSIYREAHNVVVWLGPIDKKSDTAMAALMKPFKFCFESTPDVEESIFSLFYRPYWRRAWVQQELHLAKDLTFHCGGSPAVTLALLEESVHQITSNMRIIGRGAFVGKIIPSPAYSVLVKRQSKDPSLNSLGTWLAVCIYRDLLTSEPRDLIYAMLGVSSNCQNGELMPDYTKSLQQVYIETIAFCEAQESGFIDLWFLEKLAGKLGLYFDTSLQEQLVQSCGNTTRSLLSQHATQQTVPPDDLTRPECPPRLPFRRIKPIIVTEIDPSSSPYLVVSQIFVLLSQVSRPQTDPSHENSIVDRIQKVCLAPPL